MKKTLAAVCTGFAEHHLPCPLARGARLCLATLFVAALPVLAQDAASAALGRMDQAAPGFRGLTASVTMMQYTKLLDDKSSQPGKIQMQRPKAGEIRAILDFPHEQTLAFSGKNVILYYPKTNQYSVYQASKLGSALNQFLLLGFGSSGQELKRGYTVTADGTEKINGKNATKLMLAPKDPKVAEKLPKAELWIPDDAGYPVQQQFWEPASGNYRLLTYSDIKINPPISGTLEFKPPAGAQKQK